MIKVLITGGRGGIAQGIVEYLKYMDEFEFLLPGKDKLDVSNYASVSSYFKQHQDIDVVINNAGVIHPSAVKDSNVQDWIRDIEVNLIGTYLVSREALIHGNPTIINISSMAGYSAYKEWSSYCASKAGVISLTKSLSAEGRNVYVICPSGTDTKFRDKIDIPNNNLMNPKEIGKIIFDIFNKKYQSGDSILVRKNMLKVR